MFSETTVKIQVTWAFKVSVFATVFKKAASSFSSKQSLNNIYQATALLGQYFLPPIKKKAMFIQHLKFFSINYFKIKVALLNAILLWNFDMYQLNVRTIRLGRLGSGIYTSALAHIEWCVISMSHLCTLYMFNLTECLVQLNLIIPTLSGPYKSVVISRVLW